MKKTLAVVLALILLLSCFYTGVWAADNSQLSGENLMKDYTYKNWKVTSRATINAPTDSFSGDTSNAFSVTKLMWRSAYTKINLEAGETYELSFYYKEDAPNKVWLTDAGNRGVAMAPASGLAVSGVDEIAVDYSKNLLNDLNYNIPSDKDGWNIVSAEVKPSVSGEHLLYFTGAAASDGSGNGNLDLIHFSDFSLIKKAPDKNAMANIKASDWYSGWNGNTGEKVGDAITVKTAWRSGYTKLTLKPNTEYNFNFEASTVKISDVRVYAASEITSESQLQCPSGGGNLPGGTNNLATGEFNSSAPAGDFAVLDAATVATYYTVSETFTTGKETEYYIILDCTQFLNNGTENIYCTFVHLKNLKLIPEETEIPKEPEDTNLFNDDVMKALTWNSLWASTPASSKRNPKTGEPDKAQSYSGNAYVMTWGGNSRYRDNYTTVTLEPNTAYSFSFRYKSGGAEEHIPNIGFIDASKVNLNTVKSDYVKNHITDTSATILGSDATVEQKTDGSWNLVSAEFTTGDGNEYVFFINVTFNASVGSFTSLTLSDFSLVADEKEPEPQDPNVLKDDVMKSLSWSALWGSAVRNPKSGEPDKAQSYSGNAYVMTWGANSRWRDNYTTVTLEPNTTYNFSFRYKSGTLGERLDDIGFVDASKTDFSTIKGDYVTKHLTDASTPVLGKGNNVIGRATDGSWNEVKTTFTTTDSTQYVMFLQVNYNGGDASAFALTLSDFCLVADEKAPEQSENLLANTKGADWTSSWGPVKGTDEGDAIKIRVAYRSAYTKVTLKPNTKYELSFKNGEVRVADIRVYDAAEITDLNSQMVTQDSNGGFVKGGNTDLSPAIITTDCPATPVAGQFYSSSEKFTTSSATEYYIILDCNTFSTTSMLLKDLKLVEVIEEEEKPEKPVDSDNLLANTKASEWTSSWGPAMGVPVGNDISLRAAYRSGYTKVTLKPNVTYHFNFNFEHVKIIDIRVYDAAEITDLNTQMVSGENGGAVTGGKNNLADETITTDCGSPEPNKVYSAFEEFTTTSATEYYIILDFAQGDGVSNNILLKNLSLKKYYDATTDVFGTLRTSIGGDVQNKGKHAYEKGKETTVKAIPLSGNSFEGWYNANGNKVSSDKEYTFTVEADFDLTAKFSGANMPYVDWMAENGMDGTFENGAMPGWYAVDEGTGVVATYATFNPNTFASHSGEKAMAMIARYQHSYFHFNNLSKNSDYYLSFYIYCPDTTPYDSKAEIGSRGFKINQMFLNVGGDTYWSKNNIFSDGDKGWHRVEFFFNTGNTDNATLCINYYGDVNIQEKAVYLDDVTFVQYAADSLDNGDFKAGMEHWMGDFEVQNESASLQSGKKLYQSVEVEPHSLYTVNFRAKGELKAAATQINKYSAKPVDLVNSVACTNTSGDWNNYSFEVYTGINAAINLVFEALADGTQLDDIKITKDEDAAGAIVEKIDFETDRFAIKNHNTDKEVYEIYEGSEFAKSGNKSLHFKYNAADAKTEYSFQESYLGIQISNSRVYKISFNYKTSKGNTIKISPDFLGTQAGKVGVTHTAAGDGWYRVDFFASSSSAIYFDPIISNIVGKTKADFYIDDITYSIVSAAVLDNRPTKLYAEPPVALLYNEGFEEAITDQNWGKLPSSMKVVKGDTQFGNKYLNVSGKTFYVLPVTVEAGVQYYFSASVRGNGGYIGLSTTADGKGLFSGVTGEIESFVDVNSKNWKREGFKFSAPMSGKIYLVINLERGEADIDNVLIYKEQYALDKIPNGHDIPVPYDYTATSGKNYVVNGGYNADGTVNDESPATGDNFPAIIVILLTLLSSVTVLLSARKNKKEAE